MQSDFFFSHIDFQLILGIGLLDVYVFWCLGKILVGVGGSSHFSFHPICFNSVGDCICSVFNVTEMFLSFIIMWYVSGSILWDTGKTH